jgi:hypothetical protein
MDGELRGPAAPAPGEEPLAEGAPLAEERAEGAPTEAEPANAEQVEVGAEEETGGLVVVPGFQFGGRVERTGIALVHEGEYVVPAPGSQAVITPDEGAPGSARAGGAVYQFPVQIEVVGELGEEQVEAVARRVMDQLDTALRART